MVFIGPAEAGTFRCTFSANPELSVRLRHRSSLLYRDGFPAKLTAKESLWSALQSLFALRPGGARDSPRGQEFWGLAHEFRFQQLKFWGTAMELRDRSQEPVCPSVVPLRSYSSLNLQQVASCDFYLYRSLRKFIIKTTDHSTKEQSFTRTQQALYYRHCYQAMETCPFTINSPSFLQKGQEQNT